MKVSFRSRWMLGITLLVSIYSFGILLFTSLQAVSFWSINVPMRNIHHLDGDEWAATPDYTSRLSGWLLYVPTDSNADPKASNLRVMDANGELGPAHSRHVDIITLGAGRYSYWEHVLRFSTRDNLSPVTASGGMSISVAVAPQLLFPYVLVAWLVAILILLRVYLLVRSTVYAKYLCSWPVVLIFALGFYTRLLINLHTGIILHSDSFSYLLFSTLTTTGYSLFIHAIIFLGSPYYIVILQFVLAAFAITYFCLEFEQVFSPLAALIVGLLLVIKGDTNTLHYSMLTDSLAFSCVLVLMGLWLRFVRSQKPEDAIKIAVLLLIGVILRPALLVLMLPTIAIAAYFYRSSRKSFLILLCASIFAPIANTPLQWVVARGLKVSRIDHYINTIYTDEVSSYHTPYWHRNGRGAGILLGEMMLLQSRFAITDDQQTRYPTITHNLVKAMSSSRKAFDEARTWQDQYQIFEGTHNNGVANKVTLSGYYALCKSHTQDCLRADSTSSEARAIKWKSKPVPDDLNIAYNKLQEEIALETIKAHPEALLYVTWIKLLHASTKTLIGQWSGWGVSQSTDTTARYWHKRYGLDFDPINVVPLTLQMQIDRFKSRLLPYLFISSVILSIFFLLFLFNIISYNKRFILLSLFSFAGVTYTVFVCLLEPPIPRYGVPAAPLYLSVFFGTADVALTYLVRRWTHIKQKYKMDQEHD